MYKYQKMLMSTTPSLTIFSDSLDINFPPKLKSVLYHFIHALLEIILVEACQVIWSHSAGWQSSSVHSLNPTGKEPIPFTSICHIHFESGGKDPSLPK